MNDTAKNPIDVEEQLTWLKDHKTETGASWSQIAKRIDIPQGTLSAFGGGTYKGDNSRIAQAIYRYRQLLSAQTAVSVEAPEVPGYFETPTSRQLTQLLTWAQRGRIVVAAMNAGLSKTSTAKQFEACFPNVFMVTMSPSTAGVNNMQIEVLDALGEPNASGTPQRLSKRIRDRVKDLRNPLIIIDEAQHLSEKAIEEIRSWHDATGTGIALFGNIGVMQRLEGGSRKSAYAQIFSRVAMRVVRTQPLQGDADALAEAWGIDDIRMIEQIRKVSLMPGGLRGTTMMLELASMLAVAEQRPLSDEHLQDAWTQLAGRRAA
tara:strand:+ start:195 stop:1151 length:957 start_codon:yes stop_codon:yes gene_type:complete